MNPVLPISESIKRSLKPNYLLTISFDLYKGQKIKLEISKSYNLLIDYKLDSVIINYIILFLNKLIKRIA